MSDNNVDLDSHDHDGLVLINSFIKENENPNVVDFLDDLDSNLEVSRFVSDSVTRGMLIAVETEERKIVSSESNDTSSSRLILDQAERLWDQNLESCSKKSLLLDDQKTKEIAGLRRELELISKLLSGYVNGDIDEALEIKLNADQLNRKVFGSVGSTSSSIWVENGLRHLSHEELINYFQNEMNQMKREHDFTIHAMTEEYFSIKRRCLNLENHGSFSCLKKDKEFDVLRKKIPDFISKLDKVLSEDENSADTEFKSQRVDSLLLENRQLKERLIDFEDSCAKERVGYKMEISELRQKLELARENMNLTENEKVKFEMKLVSTEAEQTRLKHQFVSTVLSLANWSQGFDSLECVLAEKMEKTNSRLESMQSHLSDLLDEVDELKARESMYKEQMEKKTCDLHKAETEVDLLGDEVGSLLNLLTKIYIALDHYSLILKHYPGIIEILKLVRRELRGEPKRLSVFRPSLI